MKTRTSTPRRRGALGVIALLAATVASLAAPGPVRAMQTLEELTATPESTAELFIRSVRAIRWSAAAQFMDDETLGRFEQTVTMLADVDSTGGVRDYLVATDAAGLAALTPAEIFDRAIGTLIDDMPGLMHSIYDRDDEIIGHVAEGSDGGHVVYRTSARISGAVPEVKVMQLSFGASGWRVVWSDELEVLEAALRGVPRRRSPPGGG